MLSTSRAADPLLPGFHARSKLAIARDVAIILLCVGLLLAFIVEVWSGAASPRQALPAPLSPRAPATMLAPTSSV
jgi:hypothetical protein